MLSKWLTGDRDKGNRVFASVADGLQVLYKDRLLPVEKDFSFPHFFSPELTDADFSARPMVMLTGQYSTGKSTFIRHLLGRDYPGLRIGPEPTTDKFVAVCKGDMDQVIPGNALVVDKSMPFTQLSHFGNNFLTRFECAKLDSPVLNGMSLIDTPGVLSGEKQRLK
ncbi:Ehd1, partial [Symbiodinium necroappetens]